MNRFNTKTFKLGVVLSILFITACSSTPKPSADIASINVSQVYKETFQSTHGCFDITNNHAKNEFLIYSCFGDMYKDTWKMGLSAFILNKQSIEKFEDAVFIDVFNEYRDSHNYLSGCSATNLIKTYHPNSAFYKAFEIIYVCEDN